MAFHERHAERLGDRFALLAFDGSPALDGEKFEASLGEASREHWGGRMPRFPVLHDRTGQTLRAWGVRAFPTSLLIDPEGRLVGQSSLAGLADRIGVAFEG
jgi:hypothetical protein